MWFYIELYMVYAQKRRGGWCAKNEVVMAKKQGVWRLLRDLGYKSYGDYLLGEYWISFKARYQQSSLPQACLICGSKKVQLHHISYKRLGCELLKDVVPLCNRHHVAVHDWLKKRKLTVGCTDSAIGNLKKLQRKKIGSFHRRNADRAKDGCDPWGVKYHFRNQRAECQSLGARIMNHEGCEWAGEYSWMFDGISGLVKKEDIVELRRRWAVLIQLEDKSGQAKMLWPDG